MWCTAESAATLPQSDGRCHPPQSAASSPSPASSSSPSAWSHTATYWQLHNSSSTPALPATPSCQPLTEQPLRLRSSLFNSISAATTSSAAREWVCPTAVLWCKVDWPSDVMFKWMWHKGKTQRTRPTRAAVIVLIDFYASILFHSPLPCCIGLKYF